MKRIYWVIPVLGVLVACETARIRHDPFPAAMDVNDHSLAFESCDQVGTVVTCSKANDEDAKLTLRPLVASKGSLMVYGCGLDHEFKINSLSHDLISIPDPMPMGSVGVCVVDLVFRVELPKGWKSSEVIRNLRGRLYFERREKNQTMAKLRWGPTVGTGMVPIRLRAGEPITRKLVIEPSRPVFEGKFGFSGCGGTIQGGFTGASFEVLLSDLVGPYMPEGNCFIFGWGISRDGMDDAASISVTVKGETAQALAQRVWFDKKKLCYEADPSTSFVALNESRSNSLKDCFKSYAEGDVIRFVTAQGRAAYAQIRGGAVEWVQ